MPNYNPNSTDYVHSYEPNTNDLVMAMDYDANGKPAIRVLSNIQGDITIEGDVNIPGTITVNSTPEDPVHNHITEVGTSGILTTPYLPVGGTVTIQDGGNSITVDGSVSVSNFPTTQTVDGTVTIQDGGNSITVDGSVSATVSGTVSVDNFPSTQTVDGTVTIQDGGNSITVDGNVSVSNFPASQTVDGTVNIGTMPDVTINQPVAVTDNGGSLTVDGSVSATVSGTVSVDNFPSTQTVDGTVDIGNEVAINDGGNSITVDGTVGITGPVNVNASFNATNYDAFGRLRVSNPVTLFDSQNRYIDGEQFSSDNSGSGSVTYNANSSNFTLSVSGNGDEVIRQAKRVNLYQPGKSLLIMNTFAFNTPTATLRQRVGYFTAQNGIFLEADGTTVYIVKRSYTSGIAVDTRIAQSNWNGDIFNGAGASGITLDVSKTQILWTDIEWLGVGSVRVGFVINGVFYIAHTFHHANTETDVYMTTASLNCRYEITSTGASGSMRQICSTVISEGGYAPAPRQSHIGNGTAEKRLSNAGTLYPLATIRLDPAALDAVVVPAQIDFLSVDVRYGEVRLVENATLTDASFSNSISSIVETDTNATAMSGGEVVFSALWASRSTLTFTEEIRKRLQLAREADGTPITLTFAAASNSSNTDVLYKFGWEELSN